ncbi:DUF6899 family protein [Halomonas rhizosphaerae]|uniref:DUF6899 family protein n=1 Tax=Halomonas rhizosphaerae TaxID=3043296 RepID=UPI00398D65C9
MPYIDQDRREALNSGSKPETAGELNYLVTRLVDAYVVSHGGLRYSRINEVVGVLECAKLEAYRRLAGPYEDRKAREAGDVYESLRDA